MATIDLARPWALAPSVALRSERFGALAYHSATRRLSFLKSPTLLTIVRTLADHPTGLETCRAAGVNDAELPRYAQALATLAATDMIVVREDGE